MQVDLNKGITDTADALTTKSLNFKNKAVKSSPWHNVRKIEKNKDITTYQTDAW